VPRGAGRRGRALEAAADRVEARLLAGEARLAVWSELSAGREQVTEVRCRVVDARFHDMAPHEGLGRRARRDRQGRWPARAARSALTRRAIVERVVRFVLKCRAVRPRVLAAGAILAAGLLLGCDRGPCASTRLPLTGPDAGQLRCVTAQDCPLTGTVLFCVDSGEPDHVTQACVRCVATECVQDVCTQR
jgi:hypothetical protein